MGSGARELDAVPLVVGPLYGLRTWRTTGERGAERLRGPYSGTVWPTGGAWLRAVCAAGDAHAVPAAGCACGVYGWHPTRRSARSALAVRREVAGIVEARGPVEVHAEGFRAREGRPRALVLHPRSNPHLIQRLAGAYGADVVEVRGADALIDWCAEHGIGLAPAALAALLGAETEAPRRRRWLRLGRRGEAAARG